MNKMLFLTDAFKSKHLTGVFLFLLYYLLSTQAFSETNLTVWEVLSNQLTLDHQLAQPSVQKQLRWLIAHPHYLENFSRSKPYIYHIITEINKRHLPGELALIPMIESAYNPFAYSIRGAAGLWQLMPGTANDLGVRHDWWFDDRRNICVSTKAALDYFVYLNHHLNDDWLLTVAAYDAGEAGVLRAIKTSNQLVSNINFWSLPLPKETKDYVPRLLALAEIIQYPERYGLKLPPISYEPYFKEVHINQELDLNQVAHLANVSYKELVKLNPGYNHWATIAYQLTTLLIPIDNAIFFNQHQFSTDDLSSNDLIGTRHHVAQDDTLDSLATRYFTTVKQLIALNHLTSTTLIPGNLLKIPPINANKMAFVAGTNTLAVSPHFIMSKNYKVIHIVQTGDTLQLLEKKYQVNRADILRWNHLTSTSITPGDQLIIWRAIQNG